MQLISSTCICQGSSELVNVPLMTLSVSPRPCPGPLRNPGARPGSLRPLCRLSISESWLPHPPHSMFYFLPPFSQCYTPVPEWVSWYRMWPSPGFTRFRSCSLNLFRSNVQLLYFIKNLGWLQVSHCKPQHCNYLEEAEMCLGVWSPRGRFWDKPLRAGRLFGIYIRKSCERSGEVKLGKEETQQRV